MQRVLKIVGNVVQWIFGGMFALFIIATGFHFSSLFLLVAAALMMPIPPIRVLLRQWKIKTWMVIAVSVVLFFTAVMVSPDSEVEEAPGNETSVLETEKPNQTEAVPDDEKQSEEIPSDEEEDSAEISFEDVMEEPREEQPKNEPVVEESQPIIEEKPVEEPQKEVPQKEEPVVESKPVEPEKEVPAVPDKSDTAAKPEPENSSGGSLAGDPDQDDSTGEIVYRAPSGTKYHLDPDCGGKNSYSVTFNQAIGAGLGPCKKCAQ